MTTIIVIGIVVWICLVAIVLRFFAAASQSSRADEKKVNTTIETDWEEMYKELQLDLIKMRMRCSSYRAGVEYALKWLQEEEADNIHPATNITHLTDRAMWDKLKTKKHNKENGN